MEQATFPEDAGTKVHVAQRPTEDMLRPRGNHFRTDRMPPGSKEDTEKESPALSDTVKLHLKTTHKPRPCVLYKLVFSQASY